MGRSEGAAAAALPTPPTDRELAILRRILDAAIVPGVEQLRDQLRMLQVAPVSDATCRVYLVHPDAPRAAFARDGRSALPTRYAVRSQSGRIVGEVAVWVQQGHLCALQYVDHGPARAMTLPAPESIELPTAPVPIAIQVRAAQQALGGVQAIDAPSLRFVAPTIPATDRPRRRWQPIAGWLALGLVTATLAALAFTLAYGRGADLDAARSAGTVAGVEQGALDGDTLGRFAGDAEGRIAGRNATYPASFVASRNRVAAQLRREAEQQRAAAAAAFVPLANTSCPGYRDSRGYWICT